MLYSYGVWALFLWRLKTSKDGAYAASLSNQLSSEFMFFSLNSSLQVLQGSGYIPSWCHLQAEQVPGWTLRDFPALHRAYTSQITSQINPSNCCNCKIQSHGPWPKLKNWKEWKPPTVTHCWRTCRDRLGIPWSWWSAVQEAGKDLQDSTSQHLEGLRQPPHLESTEHPPSPAAMAKGNTGNRVAQGQGRGVLGNCFIPISINSLSLIPGLIVKRENPHRGTSLINIPMKRELRQGLRYAGRTRGCKETPVLLPRASVSTNHQLTPHRCMVEETCSHLPGPRYEFIPRQGLASREHSIKEFFSSFLSQRWVHLSAALLLVMSHPFHHEAAGGIPAMTPCSCSRHQGTPRRCSLPSECRSPPGTPMPVCPRTAAMLGQPQFQHTQE